MSYWQDKVVVITGGSSGLGFQFAQELSDQRARVVLVARDEARLAAAAETLVEPHKALCLAADITNSDEVSQLPSRVIDEFGQVDALINCAGKSSRGELLSTPIKVYRELWELNTLALIACTQVFAEETDQVQRTRDSDWLAGIKVGIAISGRLSHQQISRSCVFSATTFRSP